MSGREAPGYMTGFFKPISFVCVSGGIVCFTMDAAQFDDAHNSYRLKCEELVAKGKWKLVSQGITSQYFEPENDSNHNFGETLPDDIYVLVFVVIDN